MKLVYVVQIAYYPPRVFKTKRAAIQLIREDHPYKEKGEPIYWRSKKDCERGEGECRAILYPTEVEG
jgi:hypothetical protein